MGTDDKTPVERGKLQCPHCGEMVKVTVAGKFVIHPRTNRYDRKMCRGSGDPVKMITRRKRSSR